MEAGAVPPVYVAPTGSGFPRPIRDSLDRIPAIADESGERLKRHIVDGVREAVAAGSREIKQQFFLPLVVLSGGCLLATVLVGVGFLLLIKWLFFMR